MSRTTACRRFGEAVHLLQPILSALSEAVQALQDDVFRDEAEDIWAQAQQVQDHARSLKARIEDYPLFGHGRSVPQRRQFPTGRFRVGDTVDFGKVDTETLSRLQVIKKK